MKRLLLNAMAWFAAASLTAGCAPAMSVSSHVDRSLDFSKYRTFDFGPADALPPGDPRLEKDPYFQDYVEGAVVRGLAARGLNLTDSGKPDLLIHYHANITDRIDVNRLDQAYGSCPTANCDPGDIWYEAGTLVLDVMDAATNKLVWRGWAQGNVENMLQARDKETIDRAVAEILKQLPIR